MKRFLEYVKDLFYLHCPECGARMKSTYYDMEHDCLVYECTMCKKEWC